MTTIKIRRDTAANWTANNPVLTTGEPGLETDTKKLKFGDGSTAWNSLAYATTGGGSPIPTQTGNNGKYLTTNGTSASWGTVSIPTILSGNTLTDYNEGTPYDLGTTSGTIAPDATNGNVQKITLNGSLTLNGFSNAVTGQTITLIIKQDGSGSRTMSSSMLFAGASKTLSTTANATDILTVYYDGSTYYASLGKGFA
jgi:Major tropism determinant N-terminal domain